MDYIENTLFATSCDAFANMKVSQFADASATLSDMYDNSGVLDET